MLRFTVVTTVAFAIVWSLATADERAAAWVFEPGPEAADAQKLGAADVQRAQKLAKEKKYDQAAILLESVSQKWPAAVHDCNLALAYLRANALTRAQLVWDLSALRNGARPKWCTGEVSTELSQTLRKKKYVPTTIDVTPGDALIEVGGVAMRNMRTVWLPPGPTVINASAPGRLPWSQTVTIEPPSTRVAITLELPPAPTPDAAVPVHAAPEAPPVVDAAPLSVEPPPLALLTVNDTVIPTKTILLVSTIGLVAAAGVTGYLTYDAKQHANELYKTDPSFDSRVKRYDNFRLATELTAGAAAVSAAIYFYLLVTDEPNPGVGVNATNSSVGVTYGGRW
jgi:hypothetical protein